VREPLRSFLNRQIGSSFLIPGLAFQEKLYMSVRKHFTELYSADGEDKLRWLQFVAQTTFLSLPGEAYSIGITESYAIRKIRPREPR
jgi:hypothetical protein